MKNLLPACIALILFGVSCTEQKKSLSFSILFTQELSDQAQDGRLLIMLANNNKSEPRFQINDGLSTQLILGIDVEGMKPGQEIVINNENAFGFPIRNLKDVPAGDYQAQALINRYETFNLKTGHTVKLPPIKAKDNIGIVSREIFIVPQ
jgi:hypothetical protein